MVAQKKTLRNLLYGYDRVDNFVSVYVNCSLKLFVQAAQVLI